MNHCARGRLAAAVTAVCTMVIGAIVALERGGDALADSGG